MATPLVRVWVPSTLEPSLNCTVPVGFEPLTGVTVAVMEVGAP